MSIKGSIFYAPFIVALLTTWCEELGQLLLQRQQMRRVTAAGGVGGGGGLDQKSLDAMTANNNSANDKLLTINGNGLSHTTE